MLHADLTIGPSAAVPPLARAVIDVVDSLITTFSDTLIDTAVRGIWNALPNDRHPDNFLSLTDTELHARYRERLSHVLPAFIYASEEDEPRIVSASGTGPPEYLVIVDPLDTSELAVRGLCGYTHVVVYSLVQQRPVVAVVGDLFHAIRFFLAYRDGDGSDLAFITTRDGRTFPISSSQTLQLNEALVTNYLMRPLDRFLRLAKEDALLRSLSQESPDGGRRGRIGVDFGSVGLCHVAAGFTDAMIEVSKGFAIWDLFPGQYILETAGGVVAALDGTPLSLNLNLRDLDDVKQAMEHRQKFVAAGNATLLSAIIRCLSRGEEFAGGRCGDSGA